MDMLNGFVIRFWFQHNRKCMIALHPKQDIRVNGDILCALIPLLG